MGALPRVPCVSTLSSDILSDNVMRSLSSVCSQPSKSNENDNENENRSNDNVYCGFVGNGTQMGSNNHNSNHDNKVIVT